MKIKKGKWKYVLPSDIYEIKSARFVMEYVDILINYVSADQIISMRNDCKERNNGSVIQGYVGYFSMYIEAGKSYLLVYPDPDRDGELKLAITKIFEI